MTKYCVMRECENIHSWISLIGDLGRSLQPTKTFFLFFFSYVGIVSEGNLMAIFVCDW
jgi:hypothetical protein